jgi:hypothetical protein
VRAQRASKGEVSPYTEFFSSLLDGFTPPFSLSKYPSASVGSALDGWKAFKATWSFEHHAGELSRYGSRDGAASAEFSWQGSDDGEDACGRGWATFATAGRLVGHFYIHNGDDSGFVCERR